MENEPEIKHTRLSNHATEAVKQTSAIQAADAVADAGGSPRAQIDAARKASEKRLGYVSHQGARQKARALARMNKDQNND